MKFILPMVLALTACAQHIQVKPAVPVTPPFIKRQYIETFPISRFEFPGTPLVLVHPPAVGTLVLVTVRAGKFVQQVSTKKTMDPLTLTVDPSFATLSAGANVTVNYTSFQ